MYSDDITVVRNEHKYTLHNVPACQLWKHTAQHNDSISVLVGLPV